MKLYKKLAEYYDLMFRHDYKKEAMICQKIMQDLGKDKGLLLDVGCATGSHIKAFQEMGWQAEGLDNCKEMLEQAKKKLPATIFYKQKMQKIKTRKEYDAITILNRTLLFLDNKKELKKTLKQVKKHLVPGGVLVMDLDLHKDCFDPDKSETNYFNEHGIEGSITEEYDLKNKKILWSVNLSIKDNEIKRLVDNQEYILVNTKKLVRLLKDLEFKPVVYDMNGEKTKNHNQPLIIGAKKIKKKE